jgi:hypothetical protein
MTALRNPLVQRMRDWRLPFQSTVRSPGRLAISRSHLCSRTLTTL